MVTYTLASRGWSLVGLFGVAFVAYLSVAHIVWIARHGTSSHFSLGTTIFTGFILWTCFKIARRIVEVRITSDGMISFVRTIGHTNVATSQIVRLVGEYVPGYDKPEWTMRIDLARGRSIRISEFPEAKDFADRARAMSLRAHIWGTWPMSSSELRPRTGSDPAIGSGS